MRLACSFLVLCAFAGPAVADQLVMRRWEAPRKLPAIATPPPAFTPDPRFARATLEQLRDVDVVRVEELAAALADQGHGERVIAILDDAIPRDPDPERACRARAIVVRATLIAGDTHDKLAAIRALAAAAQGTAGACRTEADALIGDLAWAYHSEAS